MITSPISLFHLALFGHGFADLDSLLLQLNSLGFFLATFVAFRSTGEIQIAAFRVGARPIALHARDAGLGLGRHTGREFLKNTHAKVRIETYGEFDLSEMRKRIRLKRKTIGKRLKFNKRRKKSHVGMSGF